MAYGRRGRERGSILAVTAGAIVLFLAVMSLVVDSGLAFYADMRLHTASAALCASGARWVALRGGSADREALESFLHAFALRSVPSGVRLESVSLRNGVVTLVCSMRFRPLMRPELARRLAVRRSAVWDPRSRRVRFLE